MTYSEANKELIEYIETHQHKITNEIVESVYKWLGEDGIDFFASCVRDHGEIACVYMEGGIPHPVHLREGMQVRNHLRDTGLCADWDCHDLDNLWPTIVERALDFPNIQTKIST